MSLFCYITQVTHSKLFLGCDNFLSHNYQHHWHTGPTPQETYITIFHTDITTV